MSPLNTLSAQTPDPITVVLLGTGTPQPDIDRFGSSTLVLAGGLTLLFDAGRGASLRLTQAGIRLGAIDAVFLTHFHSDHTAGLADVYASGYIPGPFGKRQAALPLYGPEGVVQLAEGLMTAFEGDRRERAIQSITPESTLLKPHRIGEGLVFDQNGVKVYAFGTYHHDFAPTYGYRIECQGHSVVLSGDTAADPRVAHAAKGCDLLVHEVAAIHESMADNAFFNNVVMKGHTSPEEAAAIFAEARPKLAVFTHIVQLPGGDVGPSIASILGRTAAGYDGAVVAGHDLMTIRIGAAGVRVGTALAPKEAVRTVA